MAIGDSTALPLPLFAEADQLNGSDDPARHHNPDFDLHFLALTQVRGLGFNSLQALVDSFPDLTVIWQVKPAAIAEVLHEARVPGSNALAETIRASQPRLLVEGRELRDYLAKRNTRLISAAHPHFPKRLREIPDAPRWLFAEGDSVVLSEGTFVAVVGTRQASDNGLKTAEQVTWLTAKTGLGLVSGLAEGIDAAAHSMAARHSVPQVAVLGTGINVIFPTSTSSLRRKIVDTGGCVITEYLPGDNYGKSRFVQRNRIQAALSEAVCPVEGRASSGTMHTVRFAAKYGRRLFGVRRDTPDPENDMPSVLTKMDVPVFNLAAPEGRAELQDFFNSIPGTRFPTPKRPSPEFSFRNVLKAIDVVASYDELTRDEKLYLLDQVRRRLGLDEA